MKRVFMALACATALAASAMGGVISDSPFFEAEANNTLATANAVGAFAAPGGAFVADGFIGPGDVDWFSFTVPAGTFGRIVSAVYGTTPNSFAGDSTMELTDGFGIVFDDDDNIGLFSSVEADYLNGGSTPLTLWVGVSGYADGVLGGLLDGIDDFSGAPHDQEFGYKLTLGINIAPEPASMLLLGLGAVALFRRR